MASQAPPPGPWRALAAGLVLALLLGAWLAPAQAEDDARKALSAQVSEHGRRLADCKKTRDVHGLYEEIWRAPVLYRQVEDAEACGSLQSRLVHGIGPLCRHKDKRIRQCAIEALGVMQHEAGARYLKPLLKTGREKPVDPITLAAIDSAGGVRHESLVEPLLSIVKDCPCPVATGHAVDSLGSYRSIETKREEILVTLLEATLAEESLTRWKALADAVPGSLNRLTGRDVDTLDGWLELVDNNRSDLAALFVKEDTGA